MDQEFTEFMDQWQTNDDWFINLLDALVINTGDQLQQQCKVKDISTN